MLARNCSFLGFLFDIEYQLDARLIRPRFDRPDPGSRKGKSGVFWMQRGGKFDTPLDRHAEMSMKRRTIWDTWAGQLRPLCPILNVQLPFYLTDSGWKKFWKACAATFAPRSAP